MAVSSIRVLARIATATTDDDDNDDGHQVVGARKETGNLSQDY